MSEAPVTLCSNDRDEWLSVTLAPQALTAFITPQPLSLKLSLLPGLFFLEVCRDPTGNGWDKSLQAVRGSAWPGFLLTLGLFKSYLVFRAELRPTASREIVMQPLPSGCPIRIPAQARSSPDFVLPLDAFPSLSTGISRLGGGSLNYPGDGLRRKFLLCLLR